jgi:hypothetical protein
LKARQKGGEDEEKDVSSYWMTLKKRKKRKHWIALSEDLALEVVNGPVIGKTT